MIVATDEIPVHMNYPNLYKPVVFSLSMKLPQSPPHHELFEYALQIKPGIYLADEFIMRMGLRFPDMFLFTTPKGKGNNLFKSQIWQGITEAEILGYNYGSGKIIYSRMKNRVPQLAKSDLYNDRRRKKYHDLSSRMEIAFPYNDWLMELLDDSMSLLKVARYCGDNVRPKPFREKYNSLHAFYDPDNIPRSLLNPNTG